MQQFSAKAFQAPAQACALVAAAALCFTGCRQEEIRTSTVPKEAVAARPSHPQHAPSPRAPIHWTTPAGWEELPAGGMRAGSFAVTKDNQRADVSIIPLGGISGSELDNVNRWRNQVGLAPLSASELAATAEKVTIGSSPGALYDLAGTDPQSKQPARILASILGAEGTTWFFKMTGPDALVAGEKEAFKQLLASVRFETGAPDAADEPDGQKPISTNVERIPGGTESKPQWETPAGWQELPATSMRVASFLVSGQNGEKADMSVIKLSGLAGGVLANVNRWRSQVGLEPVDEAGLEKLVTTRDVAGQKLLFVDMDGRAVETGDPARVLAAIVPQEGTTWFYKLFGHDKLVAAQKEAFVKFVESARYPHAL